MQEEFETSIRSKIKEHDIAGARSLCENYREQLLKVPGQSRNQQWLMALSTCRELMGDIAFESKSFNSALRQYEMAWTARASVYNPTDDTNMLLCFKIERALSLLDGMDQIGEETLSHDAWTQSLLVDDDKRGTQRSDLADWRVQENTQMNLIWEEAQKRIDRKGTTTSKSVTRSSQRSQKALPDIGGLAVLVGAVILTVCSVYLSFSQVADSLVAIVSDGQSFTYPSSEDRLEFGPTMVKINGQSGIRYLHPGKDFGKQLNMLLFLTTNKCIWLQPIESGIKMPSGAVLFERNSRQAELIDRLPDILSTARESKDKPVYDYTNPYENNETREVVFTKSTFGNILSFASNIGRQAEKYSPGTIICVKQPSDDEDLLFGIVIGEDSRPIRCGRAGSLYWSGKNEKSELDSLTAGNAYRGMILCNPASRIQLLTPWMILLLSGTAGGIFYGIKKQWQLAAGFALLTVAGAASSILFYLSNLS